MSTRTKTFPAAIKALDGDGDEGMFEAIVSVFGNVDLVGDRVVKGAFAKTLAAWAESGDPIPVIWNHDWYDPMAHLGTVLEAEERDEGLWVKAQVDRDTEFGAQVWRLVKSRRVKEFSFAYDIVDERKAKDGANELLELELFEVGPTLKGANPATQLLGAKRKRALPPHGGATSEETWDGPANEANLSTDAGAATYRKAYAWVDPEGDPDTKAAYKFIHHHVSDDGEVGAASLTACTTGIGVLNGGRGGTNIPDGDRAGVYAHLARHLRDGDREPPELRSASGAGPDGAKAGRVLSAKNEQALRDALGLIQGVLKALDTEGDEATSGTGGQEPKATSPARARSGIDLLLTELNALELEGV